MFTIVNIAQPASIEEAYGILIQKRTNAVLGGCAFLKMGSQRIDTGIDLSNLGLNYIEQRDGFIEIGATTTFREIETSALLLERFSGILPQAVGQIIGVQFRHVVTLGASVFSRYGFSDLLTALLVLDTEVELYKHGRMALQEFLSRPPLRDILTRIYIKADCGDAAYQCLRNSASDFPILNAAASYIGNEWHISVGARPGRAVLAIKAAAMLTGVRLQYKDIERAAECAAEELTFGSNMRGTAQYRKSLCKVLVKRAITGVAECG